MQLFLDEVATRHPNDNIVMVLVGAGWHASNALRAPPNMRLLFLPIEHLWVELCEKHFHNRVFDSLDAVEDQFGFHSTDGGLARIT